MRSKRRLKGFIYPRLWKRSCYEIAKAIRETGSLRGAATRLGISRGAIEHRAQISEVVANALNERQHRLAKYRTIE